MSLLDIADLFIEYRTEHGPLEAVDEVSLNLEPGEILGIVGESGCGKTTVAKSIQGILPDNGRVTGGEIRFKGTDLTRLDEHDLNEIRWKEISYIAQSAMNSLDPVYRIGSTFREVIRRHTDLSKKEARDRTVTLLENVGLDAGRIHSYPHELSGGQRQRAVIALALALDPAIVIADEPTTGLDVVVQDDILQLIKDLQAESGNAMIIITHDINVVAEIADRVAVMYAGQVVESGTTRQVFKESAHPYSIGLWNAFPTLDRGSRELISIPGSPPSLIDPPTGCRFSDRCPFSTDECDAEPPLMTVGDGHESKCHYADEGATFREESRRAETWMPTVAGEDVS